MEKKKTSNKLVDRRHEIRYRKNIISATNLSNVQSIIKCHFVEYGWKSKDGPHTETKLMAVDKRRITVLYLEKQPHFGQFYISRFYNTLFFLDMRKYPVLETTTNYLHTLNHPEDKLRTTSYIGKICQATHLEIQPFFHLQLLRQA